MLTFKIPKGMAPDVVAKTFAAYLIGPAVFNTFDGDRFFHGPYRKKKDSDMGWQLDGSNDYWLHIKGDEATLNWRYPSEEPIVRAMLALFQAQEARHAVR